MDFSRQEQKSAAYRKLNPNGKIPTLVDHGNGDFVIWESNAVLKYLCNEYDKEGRLTVQDPKEQYQLDQCERQSLVILTLLTRAEQGFSSKPPDKVGYQFAESLKLVTDLLCAGVYFGQAQWFMTWHPEKLPSAIDRWASSRRIYDRMLINIGTKTKLDASCPCWRISLPNETGRLLLNE